MEPLVKILPNVKKFNSYFSDAAEYTLLLQIKKMLVGTFHNNGDE